MVKHLPAMWETPVRSLDQEESPGEGRGRAGSQGGSVGRRGREGGRGKHSTQRTE